MTAPAPLLALLGELSALPYENLSKIVAFHQATGKAAAAGPAAAPGGGFDLRKVEKALALSTEWLADVRLTGAGGTCFALTWWLERRLRAAGFASGFLLADKGRARAIHCGLRVEWDGRAFLLDPGYMIFEPLPLPDAGLAATLWAAPNEVRLEDLPAGTPVPGSVAFARPALPGGPEDRIWRLWSGPRGAPKWRFDFRRAPATEGEFLAAWEASYAFPMMGYPVLNRVRGGVQHYLQKRSLLTRGPDGSEMRKLDEEEMRAALTGTFGVDEALAREALGIVTARDPRFFAK